MQYNHEKMQMLEDRAVRLMAVSKGAGQRYERAHYALEAARAEFERQRSGRDNALHHGGVPRLYERQAREAAEVFRKAGIERDTAECLRDESGALVDRCHRFLRDEYDIDLRKKQFEPGDSEIIFSEAEVDSMKRRGRSVGHLSKYIYGEEQQR